MRRVSGQYRGIQYAVEFEQGETVTKWKAIFRRLGLQTDADGQMSSQRFALPSMEAKVSRTMELYVELLIMRGDGDWWRPSLAESGASELICSAR